MRLQTSPADVGSAAEGRFRSSDRANEVYEIGNKVSGCRSVARASGCEIPLRIGKKLFRAARLALGTPVADCSKKERLMPASLRQTLCVRHHLTLIDESCVEAFLAPPPDAPGHAILFFAGDPTERSETRDVAVILPQLLQAFAGRLRGGLVSARAEAALKDRFHVRVFPSLVIVRGVETLGVLPKVYDWSDYLARIGAMLQPGAPALETSSGPRVKLTYSSREAAP
jgi:hydrogenase-1 operon protein HyaE